MSIYTGVGSKARQVSKLYVGVGGKARQVTKAYVGVGGKARLIYNYGTPLSSLAVGTEVYALQATDGTFTPVGIPFVIVHQGNPDSSIYDASCNGTWLMQVDSYHAQKFNGNARNSAYAESTVHSFLNGSFLAEYNSDFQNSVKQVKIPYLTISGYYNLNVQKGANGLSTKCFLPSAAELGFVGTNYLTAGEGAKLAYFKNCAEDGADDRRVLRVNGKTTCWWTRSACSRIKGIVFSVLTNGNIAGSDYTNDRLFQLRPIVILNSSACVDEQYFIIG